VTGSVSALSILFAVLSDGAYALIVGCLLAMYWLSAPREQPASTGAFPSRLLQRWNLACCAVLIVSQIVRPWFVGASMSGSANFAGNLALIPDILSSTHQGKLWLIGSGALAVLLVSVLLNSNNRSAATLASAGALFLLACTKAASGHASDDGDFTLAEFSMLLHVAGTAVWAGTIIVSGLLVLPRLAWFRDPAPLWSYGRLLSKTVTWALVAILLSGVYTSDRELSGTLNKLWGSGWGRVLMTKLAFILVALSLGAFTRFRCVQPGQKAALMVRLVRTEAAVMIVILCLSGKLANTPPAM
jgi:putative copper resistance protein D